MTVQNLIDLNLFKLLNLGDAADTTITKPFCCDLLSIAMGRAPAGCAWVSVMANLNTLAVASLADCACIILAEDTAFDEAGLNKAAAQGITVFTTPMPAFDAALCVHEHLNA